jgi:UDP-2,3-diacylglucosamine pyrophosphatase LpxH
MRLLVLLSALACLTTPIASAQSARSTVFISDLHVGPGRNTDGTWKRTEDFRWQDEFEAFLAHVSQKGGHHVDLVLAGDVIEMWQSPSMSCSTDPARPGCTMQECNETDSDLGCSERDALVRLKLVLQQHPRFLPSLKAFASRGSNRVFLIPGNHDAALLFPALRNHLMETVAHPRFIVNASGTWLSDDALMMSDHGHQFDPVNRFATWPRPFKNDASETSYLERPWGENMVQKFYNQYEEIFPIIDNLSDEGTGVSYALKQSSAGQITGAVGRFFRFFLFEQSVRQLGQALGKDVTDSPWDRTRVKRLEPAFFVEALQADEKLHAEAAKALQTGELTINVAELTDLEIDALCTAKLELQKKRADLAVRQCPALSENLGALVTSVQSADGAIRLYLKEIFPALKIQDYPLLYVRGHTHRAEPPRDVSLGSTSLGLRVVKYANTGAFQRVSSPSQLEQIVQNLKERTPRPITPLELSPEQLPPCYNFVWVPPYSSTPTPALRQWANRNAIGFAELGGACLAN